MHFRSESQATPDELINFRLRAGHTQQEAADFLHVKKRTFQNWEYGISRIPFGYLELYELKAIRHGLIRDE